MAEIGTAYVTLIPSAKGMGKNVATELDDELGDAGKKGGDTAAKGFKGTFKKGLVGIGGAMAGMFALSEAKEFFTDAVSGASDLSESASKTGVVFGKFTDQVTNAAKTSAKTMGMSEQAYLESTSTFGNLLVALGLGPKKAADMSQSMVKLAGDLGSFNNVSSEEALLALRAGLAGETEPLKKFGVNMNEATIKAQAMSMGLLKASKDTDKIRSAQVKVLTSQNAYNKAVKKSGKDSLEATKAQAALGSAQSALDKVTEGTIPTLTAQQKALAAQGLIMAQTTTAQGDYVKTAGGLAGTQKRLSAETDNVKASIGEFLLPVVTNIAHILAANVIPAVSGFVEQMRSGTGTGGKFADAAKSLWNAIKDLWGVIKDLWPVLVSIGKFLAEHPAIVYAAAAAYVAFKIAVAAVNTVQKIQAAMTVLSTTATVANATATTGAAVATGSWAAAMWALIAPIALVVLAIVAIVAIVWLVIKYHKQIGAFMVMIWNKIKGAIGAAVSWVIDFVKTHWQALLMILTGPIGIAVGLIIMHWDKIKAAISAALGWIVSVVTGLWSRVTGTLVSGGQAIVDFVVGLPGRILALASRFAGVGQALIGAFIDGLKAAAGFVGGIAGKLWDALRGLINNAIVQLNDLLEFTVSLPFGKSFTIDPPDIPQLASGGRANGSIVQVGDGRGWESIVPDHLMAQALTTAAAGGAAAAGGGGGGQSLRLVVDGYEFSAYVDGRADGRVASASDLAAQQGRASWASRR